MHPPWAGETATVQNRGDGLFQLGAVTIEMVENLAGAWLHVYRLRVKG
jgi:hypothetical protein